MDPFVGLLRRWAVDWLAAADPSACADILAPEYTLLIGGYSLGQRDEYIAATLHQLGRFTGLGITVHELISSGDRVALRFTEHGASAKLDGRTAAWRGVALFRWNGAQLTECFAEEDYLSRRRQLDSGECDPIEPPAPEPWNTPPRERDATAEQVVRRWLDDGGFAAVTLDDGDQELYLQQPAIELDELFSAGSAVAFHGVQRAGGAALHLAGIVHVEGDAVVSGHVIRDRLGLQRSVAS